MRNDRKHTAIRTLVSICAPPGFLSLRILARRGSSLLILLALIGSTSIGKQIKQGPDTQRKIVSDDFVKSRRKGVARAANGAGARNARRTYRLASNPTGRRRTPTENFKQLGITIWRLRPARKEDPVTRALLREKVNGTVWTAERITSDGILRAGDHVRLSVESPRRGYLYVIDRDLFADGTTGEPKLIFPWAGADNKLAPGRLIDIPGEEDDPNYFTARLTGKNQAGELLTFIVTSTPLNLALSNEPLPIALTDLTEWETAWGGVTERYEMEGGAGEVWTRREQQAARHDLRRQLTRNDPAPQTIYRVFNKNNKGTLVNVRLKYEN